MKTFKSHFNDSMAKGKIDKFSNIYAKHAKNILDLHHSEIPENDKKSISDSVGLNMSFHAYINKLEHDHVKMGEFFGKEMKNHIENYEMDNSSMPNFPVRE